MRPNPVAKAHCLRFRSGAFAVLTCLVGLLGAFSAAEPATSDSEMSFDFVSAPSSPGFVLLGIEPSSVERPSPVKDITVVIQSRRDDLSVYPLDFAFELAPYWLFGGKGLTYEQYADHEKIGSSCAQTAAISIAGTSDSAGTYPHFSTSLAVGFRFSPLRGAIDSEFGGYASLLTTLSQELDKPLTEFHSEWKDSIARDPLIALLASAAQDADSTAIPIIEERIRLREDAIKLHFAGEARQSCKREIEHIRGIISRLQLRRVGWKLDVAGGGVFHFPRRIFEDGSLTRWGAWLTGGYEWRRWGLLGVLRYLGNCDDPDEASWDIGGRLIADNFDRFSFAVEGVYRGFPGRTTDAEQSRVTLNFDYAFGRNKAISFAFGRDFERKSSGDLISIISLSLGFGSKHAPL
jgi:hypothetical protein